MDLWRTPEEDFQRAAEHVLRKNEESYRRLAKGCSKGEVIPC